MQMKFLLLIAALVVALSTLTGATDPIVMKPIKSGTPVGLVMIQGAEIPAKTYIPLAKALQEQSSLAIYIAIPTFALNTPEPLVLKGGIEKAEKALYGAGLKTSDPLFLAGHSLGGAMLQDYVSTCTNCAGQILMGAGLLRKYRGKEYPVKTLTIDGTLDGLYRVTRQAESFYHFIQHGPASNVFDFPVVVYEGVSHMQFASGPPPALVKKSDLKPEVSESTAHNLTAQTISLFLDIQTKSENAQAARDSLTEQIKETEALLAPIIASLEQEGFKHFLPPCNSDYPMPSCPAYPRYPGKQRGDTPQVNCTCGTPWSVVAQQMMGGLQDVAMDVTDSIHPVSDINPIHLPHVWNTCTDEKSCTLNITTVTEAVYEAGDSLDTGFFSTSAKELRVKLMSRQSVWVDAGRKNVDFNATDVNVNTCADINKAAFAWAMKNAGAAAQKRFENIGEPLKFGPDLGPYNAGPLWIYNGLKYKQASDKSAMTIQSPMMHTPIDYTIKAAAGFHYCKLLSPARAMEWIYIDGLRAKGGL